MPKHTLSKAAQLTKKVSDAMPNNKGWAIHTRFVELVEEVGELGNAIQTTEGYKSKKRAEV